MVFDNKAEKASKDRQVKQLVLTIRRLLKVNGGRPFTNKLLDIVERCMQQREQELQEKLQGHEGTGRGDSGDGRYVLCTGTAGGEEDQEMGGTYCVQELQDELQVERRIRRREVRTVYKNCRRNCRGTGGSGDGRYVLCTGAAGGREDQEAGGTYYVQPIQRFGTPKIRLYRAGESGLSKWDVCTTNPGVWDTQHSYVQPIQVLGTPRIHMYSRFRGLGHPRYIYISRGVGTLQICTYVQPNQGVWDTQDMYVCTAESGGLGHTRYVRLYSRFRGFGTHMYVCTADSGGLGHAK